jgi:hypothetical protein
LPSCAPPEQIVLDADYQRYDYDSDEEQDEALVFADVFDHWERGWFGKGGGESRYLIGPNRIHQQQSMAYS